MSFGNCKDTKKYWFPNSICLFMGVFYTALSFKISLLT